MFFACFKFNYYCLICSDVLPTSEHLMLFNSLQFILLVVATLLLYYLSIARSWQVLILAVSSFVFYGSDEPWLLLLLINSVCMNAMTSWMRVRGAPKQNGFGQPLELSPSSRFLNTPGSLPIHFRFKAENQVFGKQN